MTKFEEVNSPRVGKLVKALEVIDKSAKSNKATPEEVVRLMAPLLKKLRDLRPAKPDASSDAKPTPREETEQLRGYADIIEVARKAPLEQALAALTIIGTRAEQEMYERRDG